MLPKERVLAAFEHRPSDRVPIYQAGLSSRVASAVLGREAYVGGGIQQWRESKALWEGDDAHKEFLERTRRDTLEIPTVLGLDYVRTGYWRMTEKPTKRIDEYTFMYGDSRGAYRVMRLDPDTELYQVIDKHPKEEPSVDELEKQVEASEKSVENYNPTEKSFSHILDALEAHGEQRAVPGEGIGVAVPNRSQVWLEAVALRPDIVKRYLAAQSERAVRNVEVMARIGVRYIQGGGDFASNRGPNYSPKSFHELMLPQLQRISDACHEHGLFNMFASDGDLWPVADDLFGASGMDAFYEIDGRAGMDLVRLRERFPHLTLLGNICSYTLHRGTKEEVIAEVRNCTETAKEHGSIIVGCSNQIISQTPIENFMAMMETMNAYR